MHYSCFGDVHGVALPYPVERTTDLEQGRLRLERTTPKYKAALQELRTTIDTIAPLKRTTDGTSVPFTTKQLGVALGFWIDAFNNGTQLRFDSPTAIRAAYNDHLLLLAHHMYLKAMQSDQFLRPTAGATATARTQNELMLAHNESLAAASAFLNDRVFGGSDVKQKALTSLEQAARRSFDGEIVTRNALLVIELVQRAIDSLLNEAHVEANRVAKLPLDEPLLTQQLAAIERNAIVAYDAMQLQRFEQDGGVDSDDTGGASKLAARLRELRSLKHAENERASRDACDQALHDLEPQHVRVAFAMPLTTLDFVAKLRMLTAAFDAQCRGPSRDNALKLKETLEKDALDTNVHWAREQRMWYLGMLPYVVVLGSLLSVLSCIVWFSSPIWEQDLLKEFHKDSSNFVSKYLHFTIEEKCLPYLLAAFRIMVGTVLCCALMLLVARIACVTTPTLDDLCSLVGLSWLCDTILSTLVGTLSALFATLAAWVWNRAKDAVTPGKSAPAHGDTSTPSPYKAPRRDSTIIVEMHRTID